MARRIPDIAPGEPWNSPNVDTWRRELVGQVRDNEDRITTTFRGLWDQTTDTVSAGAGGGNLAAANTYQAGDYFVCSETGNAVDANGQKPELAGQALGAGDQIISDGAQWVTLPVSTQYISSVIDDTAAGVITFDQPAKGTNPAVATEDYIRKGESEAYTNNQIGSHNTNADPHAGILANLAQSNVFVAASQTFQFAGSRARVQEVGGIAEYQGLNAAGALAAVNISGTAVNLKASGGNVLWQGVFAGQTVTVFGFDSFDMANGELREQGVRVYGPNNPPPEIADHESRIAALEAQVSAHIAQTDIHYVDAPADGENYRRRDNAWARSPIIVTNLGRWTFAGTGTGFATGPATFRTDFGTFATVTEIRFNKFADGTVDMTQVILALEPGNIIAMSVPGGTGEFGTYNVTQAATVITGGDLLLSGLTVRDSSGNPAGPIDFRVVYA